jgi:hypothetical protein
MIHGQKQSLYSTCARPGCGKKIRNGFGARVHIYPKGSLTVLLDVRPLASLLVCGNKAGASCRDWAHQQRKERGE